MNIRKILILSVVAAVAYTGCKKKSNIVSTTVTASYPIVTVAGSPYVSIPVGGAFTPPSATAYDTFYHESMTVVKDLGTLDNTKPGLYTVVYSAKNHYGFTGTTNVYVAVTNITDSVNLTGRYRRAGSGADTNRYAHVTKLARGLFRTDNVGGVDTIDVATGAQIAAVFAVLDSFNIDLGNQLTSGGPLSASFESLSLMPAPFTYSYSINLSGFSSTAVRTFVKQ